ncbi:terminase [Lutibacter maritimus]|uniref:Uncharacterized protein n=1 Tax=Lutibacter maritimus TaxID=593133 RepID=A0A1I6NRZ3_9FLAO|nr:terminase [Lutibacter maritimus]SFS30693.1 hypothetical protein SAMN04488006_0472 [Lutibacter maritimus]
MPVRKKNTVKTTKRKVGRPTRYKAEYATQALKLTILGATDIEMADFFGVVESTINLWKLKHKEFSESIKKGKIEADANVASSLYKKAIGFKHPDTKVFLHDGKPVKVPVEKHYAPDSTAAIFWLKNRQPEKWRDTKNIDHTTGGEKMNLSREERDAEIQELIKKHNESES